MLSGPICLQVPMESVSLGPVSVIIIMLCDVGGAWCAGGVAGSAAELIAQERAALSNIHAMLSALESQQRSLLSSLHAKEVCCCAIYLPSSILLRNRTLFEG